MLFWGAMGLVSVASVDGLLSALAIARNDLVWAVVLIGLGCFSSGMAFLLVEEGR